MTCSLSLCPAGPLPRGVPEEQGVSSQGILKFVEAADREVDSMNSFMLIRHGKVIAEGWWAPFSPEKRHMLYSLSKSFTSTAVGLAIAEGRLSLDDPILKFFPDDAPAEPSENLKAMRVRDLLMMSTGHHADAVDGFSFRSGNKLTKQFLAMPVAHKPGTYFYYNTPATYMLSAIVQAVTGRTTLDYLRPRLFEPLGIAAPEWESSPEGVSLGGYGLSIRTEDIASFGQLYLQRGQWQGKQLVPAGWIDTATARQTSNGSNPDSDWEQGYGFQFWRCRHGFYRGDGAFGQFCIVMPEYDAVLAITSGTRNMGAVMNLVWDNLLPAMHAKPLPANSAAQGQLASRLKTLQVPPQMGTNSPAPGLNFSGRTYRFGTNALNIESAMLKVQPGHEPVLALKIDGRSYESACGAGAWREGRLAFGILPEQPAAFSGAWTTPDTFTARVCFDESPYIVTFDLHFDGGQLQFDSAYNVAFGASRQPRLTGSAP
ncbi:MAG: serine hydrolase [Verrucomicrobiota bacterium]